MPGAVSSLFPSLGMFPSLPTLNPGTGAFEHIGGGGAGAAANPGIWPFSNTNVVPSGNVSFASSGAGEQSIGSVSDLFTLPDISALSSGVPGAIAPANQTGLIAGLGSDGVAPAATDITAMSAAPAAADIAVPDASGITFPNPGDPGTLSGTDAAGGAAVSAATGGIPLIGNVINGLLGLGTSGSASSDPNQASIAKDSFFQNVFNIVGNFFLRGGLVLVAIILIGIALWAMVKNTEAGKRIAENVREAGKAAAVAA